MGSIRRSGGVVAFYWQGTLPDASSEEFTAALANRRFRTIENASSEETSVGWVTPLDPTGDSFANEDLDAGPATWLRLRIDTKKMPTKWLQIHRDAAEKAAGRKLSARERREMKDDLMDKLLPRVLPTINLVDALLYEDRRMLLLMATSKTVGEHFHKLFFETFGLPLERNDPLTLGLRTGMDSENNSRLERADPIRWPGSQTRTPLPAVAPPSAHAPRHSHEEPLDLDEPAPEQPESEQAASEQAVSEQPESEQADAQPSSSPELESQELEPVQTLASDEPAQHDDESAIEIEESQS